MARTRRLLKLIVVLVLAAQWYGRGGREFLFGVREETFGVGETLRTWIDLPIGANLAALGTLVPIRDPNGDTVGFVTDIREKVGARDPAGYAVEQYEAHVEVERARLGYPINVALSQASDWTRSSLGLTPSA